MMIRQAVTVAASVGAISISSLRTSPLYDKARPGNQYPRRPAALKGGPAAPTFPVMDFPDPLLRGTLVKRYKRFLSDVELADGTLVTAHCANPGAMLGLTEPGSEVWLSPAANPARKLKYSWEMIRVGDHLVGINTSHPNAIVAEAVAAGRVPELAGYGSKTATTATAAAARPAMSRSRTSTCAAAPPPSFPTRSPPAG
jgi:hypothetical protein